MPSSTGYLISAIVIAVALFFGLWWILVSGGDEAPWLPAGLAASVVLLVALSAREVVMRRAWTRYLLENGIRQESPRRSRQSSRSQKKGFSSSLQSAALRAIQKQSSAADHLLRNSLVTSSAYGERFLSIPACSNISCVT